MPEFIAEAQALASELAPVNGVEPKHGVYNEEEPKIW